MKTLEEIKNTPNLIVLQHDDEGGSGRMMFGKLDASVIFSWGAGWDHVSIAPFKRNYIPSWDEMCKLKDMFFYPEETVLQYHPAQSQYVNQLGNCLHLWRPQHYEIPLPPPVMVGMQRNMSRSEFEQAVKDAYENPYALTSGMLLNGGAGT
jgi:hypothetical protein